MQDKSELFVVTKSEEGNVLGVGDEQREAGPLQSWWHLPSEWELRGSPTEHEVK